MAKKQYLLIVPLVMFLWLMPCGAWAYGKDIHFSLTYVLCRLAGIEVKDSLWIATADQSMDNNKSTTAFPGFIGTANQRLNPLEQKIYATNGKNWHDFSDAGADENANPPLPVVMIHYKMGGLMREPQSLIGKEHFGATFHMACYHPAMTRLG